MKNLILGAALLAVTGTSYADIEVIVHPSNASSLDAKAIKKIFTGKAKSFSSGDKAVPITQADSSAVTGEFNSKVIKKSSSQLKAYWSKLIFTGKGTPPKAVANDQEVIDLVAKNPNMIGFVSKGAAGESVKVVQSF